MIRWLSGTIIAQENDGVVIDTQGVGYKVITSCVVGSVGERATYHIYHHIREDAQTLYGFETVEQRAYFELFLTVSGVGPKLALVIISRIPVDEIRSAIIGENPALFQSLPGVGAKVAAKIVVELKNKLSSQSVDITHFSKHSDLVDGLIRLGYSQAEIAHVIPKIPENVTQSDQIRSALQLLSHARSSR